MAKYKILLYIIFFFLVFLPFSPPQENRAVTENREYAEISLDFLNPKAVFDVLKENLRVPEFKDGKIEFPEQNGIQKDFSLDTEKYNKEIEEETGVNILKFAKWLFGLLSRLFSALADLFIGAQEIVPESKKLLKKSVSSRNCVISCETDEPRRRRI